MEFIKYISFCFESSFIKEISKLHRELLILDNFEEHIFTNNISNIIQNISMMIIIVVYAELVV